MNQAQELYREGKLTEAIASLQTYLRDRPGEKTARSFLFELLCFAGEFDRARKQLSILAEGSKESGLGAAFYLAALAGETERQAWYDNAPGTKAPASGDPVNGCLDGKPFAGIRDIDPRMGESLELFAAGNYHRISLRNLKAITFDPPARVRDLYWRTAAIETSAEMGSSDLDSILVPVLYPQTWLFDDDLTRLGRTTDFAPSGAGFEVPFGQRIFEMGGRQVPILEIRRIEFDCGEGSNG